MSTATVQGTTRSTDALIDRDLFRRDAAYQSFLLLRIGFTVAPIVFGLDKFFNVLVDWEQYLAPWIDRLDPGHRAPDHVRGRRDRDRRRPPRRAQAALRRLRRRRLAGRDHRQPADLLRLLRRRAARLRPDARRAHAGPAGRRCTTRPDHGALHEPTITARNPYLPTAAGAGGAGGTGHARHVGATRRCADASDAASHDGVDADDRRHGQAGGVPKPDARAVGAARGVDAACHRELRRRIARSDGDRGAPLAEPDRHRKRGQAVLRPRGGQPAHRPSAAAHPDRRGHPGRREGRALACPERRSHALVRERQHHRGVPAPCEPAQLAAPGDALDDAPPPQAHDRRGRGRAEREVRRERPRPTTASSARSSAWPTCSAPASSISSRIASADTPDRPPPRRAAAGGVPLRPPARPRARPAGARWSPAAPGPAGRATTPA